MIFPNIFAVLMDKSYWGDPECFRPERYLTTEGTLTNTERILIFGKGKYQGFSNLNEWQCP